MTGRDADLGGGSRHGRGIFDCPMDGCHEAIVGSYGDLLDHLRNEHPLSRVFVDGETGESLCDRVKAAQKEALKQDIHEHMVVGTKQNHSTNDSDTETEQ